MVAVMAKETAFPFFVSTEWSSVDYTDNPGIFVEFLDQMAVALRTTRSEITCLLEVKAGCSVLDVGSGAGEFLIELCSTVEKVRAVGIDTSQTMVATATSRARSAGVAVQYSIGDVQELRFPHESFDRVSCSRVLAHVENLRAALNEMTRVLAPGGRIVILEPDIVSFTIDSDNLDAATALRRRLIAGIQNPCLGRQLQSLVLDSGLDVLDVSRETHATFSLSDNIDSRTCAGALATQRPYLPHTKTNPADNASQLFVSPASVRILASKKPR
jgi:2-polyprenyl-3-methyl-5-hydroxy-6-metoxy-1,4-benzoquinol methylase